VPYPRAFRALRHAEFRVVWGTFVVGQLGFWISFVSFQALMARLTDTDGAWLGLLFFTNFIPTLVFTPFAGVVADRVERRRILMVGYSVLAVTVGTLAVLTLGDDVVPITLLPFAFVMGTVFAFNSPASQAVIAASVDRDDLASAISLNSTAANLARVVGPALAAPLLAVWNEGAAFAVYAVASVIVVGLLSRAQLSTYEREVGIHKLSAWLKSGVVHARERPPAVTVLSILAMSSLFAGAYLAVLPVVATKVFDRSSSGFTVLAAMAGVGSVFGALLTGLRVNVPRLRSVGLLVAGFGAAMVAFSAAPSWPLALVLVVPVGTLYFSAMTSINTMLQHLADDARRGRMLSLFQVGWAGLVPIGGLWLGVVAGAHGARIALGLAGAVTAIYALAAITLRPARQRAGAWETVL